MRFYLDEDLSPKVAEIARKMGADVVTARECGNLGQKDEVHLAFAAREDRCLVTRNRNHFVSLTVEFLENEQPHRGVLIVPYSIPSDRFSSVATALTEYDRNHPEGIPPYTLDFLPQPRR